MDKIIETYNQTAQKFADSRSLEFNQPEFTYFQTQLPVGSVIDIGCGSGNDTHFFLESGYSYVGIDGSHEMIRIAQQENPGARFEVMNFNQLEFPERSFDGFWASAAFLHIPKSELPKSLTAIQKVLKPNAFGLILMKEMGKSWEGLVQEKRYDDQIIERYFSFYLVTELARVISDNGFEIVHYYNKYWERSNKNWQVFFVRLK